jgi:hypothetical protein
MTSGSRSIWTILVLVLFVGTTGALVQSMLDNSTTSDYIDSPDQPAISMPAGMMDGFTRYRDEYIHHAETGVAPRVPFRNGPNVRMPNVRANIHVPDLLAGPRPLSLRPSPAVAVAGHHHHAYHSRHGSRRQILSRTTPERGRRAGLNE